MKVFLAGCEDLQFIRLPKIIDHKNILFSYFHWRGTSPENKIAHRRIAEESQMEVICDSGLFTLMFGVGKGGSYDLEYMKEYTRQYLETAKTFGISNLTIVESDVHKLLGMDAVFELRKYFEDSGLNVIYVWHKEEGLEGLLRMAEKYRYIAISVPELRLLSKKGDMRYQNVVHQLLLKIRNHVGAEKMPKIHLLGNTIQETMETTLAYSCDSTSWLAGGRYGSVISFNNGRLLPIRKKSDRYLQWRDQIFVNNKKWLEPLKEYFGHNPRYFDYQTANLYSALSMNRYQDQLDKLYPWIGLKGSYAGPG